MENGSYNKISGKKTLVLITGLIALIIILSVYSVYLVLKPKVLTTSSSFEKPTPTPLSIPTSFQRFGD